MPQLIFKGVQEDDIKKISRDLVADLSRLSDTPKDYFTLECVKNTFIFNGENFNMYPLVEVKWFDRGDECKSLMATCITDHLKKCQYNEIEVYFTPIATCDYFENGQCCG